MMTTPVPFRPIRTPHVRNFIKRPLALAACVVLAATAACASAQRFQEAETPTISEADLPQPQREMRGVWIATVKNIDWPPAEHRNVPALMRQSMLEILDMSESLNLNTILFQARPTADTFYVSDKEPWSEWLTGAQGRSPTPGYDPLAEWVEASHRRGLDVHVWINPFRARHREAETPNAPGHLAERRPDLVHQYGEYQWIDPGEPDAQRFVLDVMKDVVTRYDVDGLVFDDYFYPYPEQGKDFPDDSAWERYKRAGGTLSRNDWRRDNVNSFIRRMRSELRQVRPDLVIGVSPFGIWRPGHPAGVKGFDAYDGLYADARLWLREGLVDYLAPQLYWPIASEGQPFGPLLDWWRSQNITDRRVYAAIYTSRLQATAAASKGWTPKEIEDQIKLTRDRDTQPGQIHFSGVALMEDRQGIRTKLENGAYANVAPPPRIHSASLREPGAPDLRVSASTEGFEARWNAGSGPAPRSWIVWARFGSSWFVETAPAQQRQLTVPRETARGPLEAIAIAAVGANGADGPVTVLEIPQAGEPNRAAQP